MSWYLDEESELDKEEARHIPRNKLPFNQDCFDHISVVIENLNLGSCMAAKDIKLLNNLDITYILNVTDNIPNYFEKNDTFYYLRVPLKDSISQILDIKVHLQPAHEFIDQCLSQGKRILVHCASGVSRSATIVISYLMSKHKYRNLVDAYLSVRDKRPCVNVNIGFMKQLVALQWLYYSPNVYRSIYDDGVHMDDEQEEQRIVNALCQLCFPEFDRGMVMQVIRGLMPGQKNYELIDQIERSLYAQYNRKDV